MSAPKEGIYLDAALAVIREQVDERIDELSRRRRTRRRFGVAALSVFALASGSVAAVALAAPRPVHEPPVAATGAEYTVQCVEGDSAERDAYFTVRYRAPEPADAVRLCAQAWSSLESAGAAIRAATPEELTSIAERTVGEASTDADAAVSVSDAAFGRTIADGTPPAMIACPRGDATLVLSPSVLPTAEADRLLLCAQAGA